MSKKVNPAAVGIFVTGAVLIILTALVLLGSGKWFEKRGRFVVYFQSSANGLQEGADVLLGGVKVGSVVRMQVQFDPETREKVIPVVIELSADRLAALTVDGGSKHEILSPESVQEAIDDQGMRARLVTKSVLTGQLFVDLEFFSDTPPPSYTFPGEPIEGLTQIPSTKNEIERVLESIAEGVQKLSNIDLGEMIQNVDNLVVSLNQAVVDLDTKGLSERAKKTLDQAESAMASVEEVVGDEKIKSAIASIDAAAAEMKNLVTAIDDEAINTAITDASTAMQQAGDALKEIERAAGNVAEVASPDAAVQVRLNRTLAGIEEVSRAVKDLADYLKRNPNALISGKKRP